MRVLHVISGIDPRAGGTVSALTSLARAQVGAGAAVTVATTYVAGDRLVIADELTRAGCRVELVGPARTPLCWHPNLRRVVNRLAAQHDVVHVHALWEEIQHRASCAARRAGKPYVVSPHGMLDPWSLAQKPLKKRLYLALRLRSNLDRAAALAFTTQTEGDLAAPLGLRAPGIVEPLGVELREFDPLPPRSAFRDQYPAVGDRPMVLFLSRIHPKKGLDLLVPAFAQAGGDAAVLVIAGPDHDGYARTVRDLAQAHGVADRVVFTGMLFGPARVEAFAAADLFALPSYQENFGIAVAEAMAAGLPLVISDQVNIHHEVTAAGAGLVVPTQVAPVADALRELLTNPARRQQMGAAGRNHAQQAYHWPAIGRRWVEHYRRLAARPPA